MPPRKPAPPRRSGRGRRARDRGGEGEHDIGGVAGLARDVDRFAAALHRLGQIADEAEKVTVEYVYRLKIPADYKVMPHRHPVDEHLTVLSGTFYLAVGETFDPEKGMQGFPVGSLLVMPAETAHYAWTKEETIVQVHGIAVGHHLCQPVRRSKKEIAPALRDGAPAATSGMLGACRHRPPTRARQEDAVATTEQPAWTIDPVHSSAEFSLAYMGFSTYRTGFRSLEGALSFDPAVVVVGVRDQAHGHTVVSQVNVGLVVLNARQLADRVHEPCACRERSHPEVRARAVADDPPIFDALGLVELLRTDPVGHAGLLVTASVSPRTTH